MRIDRAVAGFLLTAVLVLGVGWAASAKVSPDSCSKIKLTEADLGGLGSQAFDAQTFSDAASAFKAAARSAPVKVRRAMVTMAHYYKKIGKADSANDAVSSLAGRDTERYTKASLVWGNYIAANCS